MIDIEQWIKSEEGCKLEPYLDIFGNLTIGWGRCLSKRGITAEEAQYLLDNDIKKCGQQLSAYTWYITQPEDVKTALMNMCFNLGIGGLLGFRKMIRALIIKDYKTAALEALDSRWAKQLPERANRVAMIFRDAADAV